MTPKPPVNLVIGRAASNSAIMKRAFLKNSNTDELKKVEENFFNSQYGEIYQNAREKDKNKKELIPRVDIQNRIVTVLLR